MTKAEKKKVIQRLKKFKQNYNFTSKQIAQELDTTEAAVSHWFLGDSLPRINKIDEILKLFNKYCIPGIIRIPKNEHWPTTYFLRVADIKDPYFTWINDLFSDESPEGFESWIEDWARQFPDPIIYRQYEPTSQGFARCFLDTLNLNTTIKFKDCFIHSKSIEETFRNYPYLNPSAFDYTLINKLMNGEDDGTT